MKWLLVITVALGVGFFAGWKFSKSSDSAGHSNPALDAASNIGIALDAWAQDHGGQYPPVLNSWGRDQLALYGIDVAFWESVEVLQYHGDQPGLKAGAPLLRYRLKAPPHTEVILKAGGRAYAVR
jgi:hypothetical protein